jgi:aldose 1-epimerase
MTAFDEVVRIGDGGIEVEIAAGIGARLHRLRVRGRDLLRTPPGLETYRDDPWYWGGFVMAPWCNRIPTGPNEVLGRVVDLPSNFRDGTAIHGQVSQAPWDVADSRPDTATFRAEGGGGGWPWRYRVEERVTVEGSRLEVRLAVTNDDDVPMPAGTGLHPWFVRPVQVAIRAAAVHPSNLGRTGRPEPVAGRLDRNRLVELDDDLDGTWTQLSTPPVELAWPTLGVRARMETSPEVDFIVAASPGEIDAVAVEPETHAPEGLRRLIDGEPGGLTALDPGGTLSMSFALVFDPAAT